MASIDYNGNVVSDENIRAVLQRIAHFYGKTIKITSGDRHSVIQGSNSGSLHIQHRAADLHVPGATDHEVFATLKSHISKFFDASEAYEVIHHGTHTETTGQHVHIGRYGNGRHGSVDFKTEGLTPGTKGKYSHDLQPIGPGDAPAAGDQPAESGGPVRIMHPVGLGGIQVGEDVRKIQRLLNRAQRQLNAAHIPMEHFAPLADDGDVGPLTRGAITIFQRDIVRMAHPDGRVDPDGPTLHLLNEAASGDLHSLKPRLHTHQHNAPAAHPVHGGGSQSAEQLLKEPRIHAMLDVIAYSEGADYDTMVHGKGSHKITDFSKHPQVMVQVNPSLKSDAAGRYQFLYKTWKNLGLPDFSPHSQDLGAVKLMQGRNMITPLLHGDFDQAVQNGCQEWASFPDANKGGASHYGGQPSRSLAQLRTKYKEALARYQ
jgi:muramidase (phage lysozyme)